MKNFIQAGNAVTVTAPATFASGDGVKVGSLFGIAATNAASGESVEIATVGVYELPKVTTDAFVVGDKVYWADATKNVTSTASGNLLIGQAVSDAGNPSASVAVRLAI